MQVEGRMIGRMRVLRDEEVGSVSGQSSATETLGTPTCTARKLQLSELKEESNSYLR